MYPTRPTRCQLDSSETLEDIPCGCAVFAVLTIRLLYRFALVQSFPVPLLLTFGFISIAMEIGNLCYTKSKVSPLMSQRMLTQLRKKFFAKTCGKILVTDVRRSSNKEFSMNSSYFPCINLHFVPYIARRASVCLSLCSRCLQR